MYPLRYWLLIFCLGTILAGCGTNPSVHETLMKEGFPVSPSGHRTLTVVWGNHLGAVNQAIHWLNDHQFLVVDRWVEPELNEPGISSQVKMKSAQMLSVAHRAEAPLVVFVQVNKKMLNQNVEPMSVEGSTPQIIEVEIRGVNAETTDIVFGAKVWNPEPQVASEQLVQDLTTFALRKALKQPTHFLHFQGQESVHQAEVEREQVAVYFPLPDEETSGVPSAPQPVEGHSIAVSKQSYGSLDPESGKKTRGNSPAPSVSRDENIQDAKPQTSQSGSQQEAASLNDSSIGLQVASGALSVLYIPFKGAYAVLGGLFGGMAYALTAGNAEVTKSVWDASWGGTFWLTPQHLRGDLPIEFVGQAK